MNLSFFGWAMACCSLNQARLNYSFGPNNDHVRVKSTQASGIKLVAEGNLFSKSQYGGKPKKSQHERHGDNFSWFVRAFSGCESVV